jgi:micrococcal nuclease
VTLTKKIISASFFLLLVALLLLLPRYDSAGDTDKSKDNAKAENNHRKVAKVIDGDTLVLSPNETVRLIGVDTPETKHPNKPVECFGPVASAFTKAMAEGKEVRLELDEVNTRRDHKDPYGRTLAYVYLENGAFLNLEIVRQGFGRAYTKFRFRYRDRFRNLERNAQENKLGLWSACAQTESQS